MTGIMSVAILAYIPATLILEGLTLDDQVRAEDTHGGDTNTGFGSSVGGAEAGENDS